MVVVVAGAPRLRTNKSEGKVKDGLNKTNPSIKKKARSRKRGKPRRILRVVHVGETPKQKTFANGRVRNFDICPTKKEEDHIPRKAREFMMTMAKMKEKGKEGELSVPTENNSKLPKHKGQTKRPRTEKDSKSGDVTSVDVKMDKNDTSNKPNDDSKRKKPNPYEGMRPGESLGRFKARLRSESKQLMIDTTKTHSRRKEKQKAYHEKRKLRLKKKKMGTNANLSEEELEDEHIDDYDEEHENLSKFPAYWQEIVRNNGRPISKKRKARTRRLEQEQDKVRFGEQADRPPQFDSVPVKRGRKQLGN